MLTTIEPSTLEAIEPSWDRLSGEPKHWYDRFDRFARPLGFEYTLPRAFRLFAHDHPLIAQGEFVNLWREMSATWEWATRARDWATYERWRQKQLWETRRQEIREADFQASSKLRELVNAVLARAPDFITEKRETEVVDGETIITITRELRLRDVLRALEASSKVARLSADLTTERTATEVTGSLVNIMVKGYVGISPDDWDSDSGGATGSGDGRGSPDSSLLPAPVAGGPVEGQVANPAPDG